MLFVMLFRVEYAKDDYTSANHLIKDFVREAFQQHAPEVSVVQALDFWVAFQAAHRSGKRIEKFASQARPPLLVPVTCHRCVPFSLRAKQQNPAHTRPRSRSSTSLHGNPASGFASYPACASSSAARSLSLGPPASSRSHRRPRISARSCALRRGSSAMISSLLMWAKLPRPARHSI